MALLTSVPACHFQPVQMGTWAFLTVGSEDSPTIQHNPDTNLATGVYVCAKASISASLLPFPLLDFCSLVKSKPNLALRSSLRMSPRRLSFLSAWPRSKCSSTMLKSESSSGQRLASLALGHLMLHILPGSLFSTCDGCVAMVQLGLLFLCSHTGGFYYLQGILPFPNCPPPTTMGPSALWFSPWLRVPLV